ncbi:MAG: type II secretion system F family protein [Pirellulales bacterium]
METASLDDFMAMNEQLAALVKAGVPIDVGLAGGNPAQSLEKINAAVARRVSRGASLADALEGELPAIPITYRRMAQLGMQSGELSETLDGPHRLAESVDDSRQALRLAFFYPLLVCILAYLGLVAWRLYFVPTLKGMYESMRAKPGWSLHVLQILSDSDALPYWIAIPPSALLLLIAWQYYARWRAPSIARVGRSMAWLPGMSRVIYEERLANFASRLSALIEERTPLEDALRLASGASGDSRLIAGADALAADLKHGPVGDDTDEAAMAFPPFLRWALWHSEATVGRSEALRMAAEIYQQSAQRRAARLRLLIPLVTCVVVGGGVTLLYGMALFVPVVEMLQSIASQKG